MLYPVTHCELPRIWETVLPYLEKVFERSPIPINKDRLYLEIAEDRMKLFLCTEGTKLKGASIFVVEDYLGIKVLNAYALAYDPDYTEQEKDIEQALIMAKQLGCEYMIGYGRRGFAKTMPPLGFKHLQTVMVKEV